MIGKKVYFAALPRWESLYYIKRPDVIPGVRLYERIMAVVK